MGRVMGSRGGCKLQAMATESTPVSGMACRMETVFAFEAPFLRRIMVMGMMLQDPGRRGFPPMRFRSLARFHLLQANEIAVTGIRDLINTAHN